MKFGFFICYSSLVTCHSAMYRPNYTVVTLVVTVLGVVAFITVGLRPFIPPITPSNFMDRQTSEFMREGMYERVAWQPLTRATMAAARQAARPILLIIGTPSSRVGQVLDTQAFTNREVASYLHRNFTCIRVDGLADPVWMNALLPYSRLRLNFQPDLQIWALTPAGEPYDFVGRTMSDQSFDQNGMLPVLIDLRNKFEEADAQGRVRGSEMQTADTSLLDKLGSGPVPFTAYGTSLRKSIGGDMGGFPSLGLSNIFPFAWRYLLITGDGDGFARAIDPQVASPMVDLLDGGFFHTMTRGTDGTLTEFDKMPEENAEAMLTLAQADAIAPAPRLRWLAESTWRYLTIHARENDTFVGGQLGAPLDKRRSDRYSFSARRMRESLSPDLRRWAVANLGLDVGKYPQAVPFLSSPTAIGPELDLVLTRLRAAPSLPAPKVEPGLASVNFTIAARAIQVARLWGQSDKLALGVDWLERLESLRVDNDIVSRTQDPQPRFGCLTDYLAYADARLQDYLASGRVRSLDLGLGVLRQARTLFAGPKPGVWLLNRPDQDMPLPNATVPEVADNLHESATARMIRLEMAYGRLLEGTPEGQDFENDALAAATAFGVLASEGGARVGSFFCSAAITADPAYAIAVGPNAQALADSMLRQAPTRLVAAAYGMVHPDLQKRPAGIYVIDGKKTVGPLRVEEAAKLLKPTLNVNPTPKAPTMPSINPQAPHKG